jgi:single-strand DNA-binding protein
MNLNKAMIIGNLTRDPEIRTTPQGQSVASFSIATNMVWTDASGQKQERVEYHNIVAWRKLAEIIGQYVKKGSKIYIEGRLQTREWTGQDNIKRYRTEIVADNMIMLDSKRSGGAPMTSSAPTQADKGVDSELPTINSEMPVSMPSSAAASNDEINIEDIPF